MTRDRPSEVTVFVYYDYLCPHSYLVLQRLDTLKKERPLITFWRPFLLEVAPSAAAESSRATLGDERSSRDASLAAQFARDLGRSAFDRFHVRLFEAVHLESRDISRRGVVLALAAECGLDTSALERSLDDGRYDEELKLARAEAERYGIGATPTLLFGRLKLIGAAPIDELRRVAELAATEI